MLMQPTEIEMLLKEQYQKLDEIDFEQYLPKFMDHKQPCFIPPNMKPIHEFQANESLHLLSVNQLLDLVEHETGNRLAVVGRPGIGKSTLARHIAKLWANGSALQHLNMLFHICVGKASISITKLEHLLEEECSGLLLSTDLEFKGFNTKISAHKGKGIAFILDGLDEYFPKNLNKKHDLILKMIRGTYLPKSTVIVTSRPRGIEDIKKHFKKLVEIVGFNTLDIKKSLSQLQSPIRSVIQKHFKNNPNVKKMCYLPLHMTMIIYLASLKEDALSDIDTETKIYSSFLSLTIEHYKYDARHELSSLSLDYCLGDYADGHPLCPLLSSVCKLAFNATIQEQSTFSSIEIFGTSVNTEILEKLSFFNIKKENKRVGVVDVFAFSHPTFQEFMSAYYLVMLPSKEQYYMISRFGNHPNMQDLVWKFFFGLIGEKENDQKLKSLFRTYVSSSGRYRQLSTEYYAIDFYPFFYAFETGKQNQTFVELFDEAKIVGPGNNYSLQITIAKPMDMKSLLNIEENGNMNFNFLFLKNALERIPIMELRIELQLQFATTSLDPMVCDNYIYFFSQPKTIEEKRLRETFNSLCSNLQTDRMNLTSIVLELAYFKPQRNAVNPQVVFSMLRSAITPDISFAQYLLEQMNRYLDYQIYQKTSSIRPKVILKALDVPALQNRKNTPSDLSEEESNFVRMWNYLKAYSGRSQFHRHSQQYWMNFKFSELRKFKLQNLLTDFDLIEICKVLYSAKKLEILDLSHNHLLAPEELLYLLKSLKQLRVLNLSDNIIKLHFIARGFKYLKGLHELNLSGNIVNDFISNTNENELSSQLVNMKDLQSLDLSRIIYGSIRGLIPGLRGLKHLRKLNLSSCLLRDDHELEKLAHFLSLTENLEVLDLSYNVIDSLSPPLMSTLGHLREVNLSSNMLNLPLSEFGLFRWTFNSRLRKLDLSHNFLCGGDLEFSVFLEKLLLLPNLEEVILINNTLFLNNNIVPITYRGAESTLTLQDNVWDDTLSLKIELHSRAKLVIVDSPIKLSDTADQMYATCVCKNYGFEKNYRKTCFDLFRKYQHSSSTNYKELDAIHDLIAVDYLTGIGRSLARMDSIVAGRTKAGEHLTAQFSMIAPLMNHSNNVTLKQV